jgi:hypothetical protein
VLPISYNNLIEKLKEFGVTDENLPTIDQPKVTVERDVKVFSSDFNLLQLTLLSSMIAVDEWEDQKSFYIIWKNTDTTSNLKRFVLFYHQKKGILRKKYVYRNGIEPRKEEKNNVSKQKLLLAANSGMSNILAEGFKQMD